MEYSMTGEGNCDLLIQVVA